MRQEQRLPCPKLIFDFLRKHRFLLNWLLRIRRCICILGQRFFNQSISQYLEDNQLKIKKLHLGCGFNRLKGWLNTDLNPGKDIYYLDFTQVFPFSKQTFDYIYAEHTIEHVSFINAVKMLKNAYQVLKKGGKIRISTPDLEQILKLRLTNKTPTQKRYLQWMLNNFILDKKAVLIGKNNLTLAATIVISNYFRDWDHQVIYDEVSLKTLLESIGFKNINRFLPGKSSDAQLRNIESHQRVIGNEFNNYESLILEAEK